MNGLIYADNAATTKLDIDAFEAMKPYLLEDYGNPSQPYFFSKKTKVALKQAREIIADCINAEPEQIIFTSGGTESDNWVIKEFGFPTDVKTIITSAIEHHAILRACQYMKDAGRASVIILPVNREGILSECDLEEAIKYKGELVASCSSKLVSVMMANNEIGTVQDIKKLCELSHKHGAAFHTDAVQAIGHIPVDVKDLDVDYLSASAHKFNGPRGIGFLYSKGENLLSEYHSGGSQEFGKRAGTEDVASIVGMAVALQKNNKTMKEEGKRLLELEGILIEGLKQNGIDFIRNGAPNHLPGNVNLSFKNSDGEMLLHRLDLMKICVSTGSACDSVNTQISHVINAICVPKEYAQGTIRISLGKDNTEEDVNRIVIALNKILMQ